MKRTETKDKDTDQAKITELLSKGATWREIGVVLGYVTRRVMRYFTPEEDKILLQRWKDNVPVQDIARELNRDWGTVRQRIMRIGAPERNGSLTRLIHRYGDSIREMGQTPDEIVANVYKQRVALREEAKAAADAAKLKVQRLVIDNLHQEMAAGKSRNDAVFDARAAGVTLKMIGDEFSVTRERIRQICNQVAMSRMLARHANSGKRKGRT